MSGINQAGLNLGNSNARKSDAHKFNARITHPARAGAVSIRMFALVLTVLGSATFAMAQQRVITTAAPGPQVTSPAEPATPSAPAMSNSPAAPRQTSEPAMATELRRVLPGETLMAISREVAANQNVSLAQAMVGLYRGNPSAFVGGDMSQLLVGSELRIPARTELTSLSRAAAFREVQQRLGIWGGAPATAAASASTPRSTLTPTPAPAPTATTTAESVAASASDSDAAAASPAEDAAAQLAAREARIAELEQALEQAQADRETEIAPQAASPTGIEQRFGQLWWLWALALAVIALLSILLRGQSRRAAEAEAQAQQSDIALARLHREQERESNTAEPPTDTAVDYEAEQEAGHEAEQEAGQGAEQAPAPGSEVIRSSQPSLDTPAEPSGSVADEPSISAQGDTPVSFNEIMSAQAAEPEDLEGDPPPIEEAGSMIDLARAYIEMGDHNAAMTELQLALKNGNEAQRAEALRLLDSLPKS
jgi:FimV-like protein